MALRNNNQALAISIEGGLKNSAVGLLIAHQFLNIASIELFILAYSFVVAGHAYGNPDTYTSSVYPPLLIQLDSIIEHTGIQQLMIAVVVQIKRLTQNHPSNKIINFNCVFIQI